MNWQEMEYSAFIHFSLNTYTDQAWGYDVFPLLETRTDLNTQPMGPSLLTLGGTSAGDILSTDVSGGFTGAILGLYATTGNDIIPE